MMAFHDRPTLFTSHQLSANHASLSEVHMSAGFIIPSFNEPVCTAQQVSHILARPRPTITGWVNRYDWLGIEGVQPGSTRLFSCKEIGVLTALRMSIAAGNMTEALFNSQDIVIDEIEQQFIDLFDGLRLEEWGSALEIRPYLPVLTPPLRLVCRDFKLAIFSVLRSDTRYDEEPLRDVSNYPFPTLTLPLGQALRNAWGRTLFTLNGFELDD
ncbi:hypothetical protein BSY17_252 [Sphingobium sp. RAC03]|nr:hypothetical protein BSY17_252 [Sphingobium sp. RAC03]